MFKNCIYSTVAAATIVAALNFNSSAQAQTSQSKPSAEQQTRKKSGRTQEINGSVFLVKKSGETVKLALVDVLVFEAEKFPGELEAAQLEATRIVETVDNLKQQKLDAWHSARRELETARNDVVAAITARDRHARSEADQRAWAAEPKEKRARDEMFAAKRAAIEIQAPSTYVARLTNPLMRQKSDADGRFKFKLSPGDYVISAFASRDVFGSSEKYGWMVKMTVSRSSSPSIMLSNDNMVGTDCTDCVLPTRVWP